MAAAISSAFQSNKTEDEQSYQPSRKAPPIPTVAYNATTAARAPELGERPIYQANTTSIRQQQDGQQTQYTPQQQQQHHHQQQQQHQQPPPPPPQYHYYPQQRAAQPQLQQLQTAQSISSRPSTQQTSVSQPNQQQTPLRGRQNINNQPFPSGNNPAAAAAAAAFVPQQQQKKRSNSFSFLRRSSSTQPSGRVAQVQAGSAAGHQSQSSDGSINSSSVFRARSRDGKAERNMLRKQSKLKQQQEEAERQRRIAEAASRPAPRLPETERLPYIESFGGDAPANIPSGAGAAANFSRPGLHNSTSSTAYPRSSATSPPPTASANGGDYYEPSGERSSSMTNRGRYSYASSVAQAGGSVNSPRRVRRRKDPTPFK